MGALQPPVICGAADACSGASDVDGKALTESSDNAVAHFNTHITVLKVLFRFLLTACLDGGPTGDRKSALNGSASHCNRVDYIFTYDFTCYFHLLLTSWGHLRNISLLYGGDFYVTFYGYIVGVFT